VHRTTIFIAFLRQEVESRSCNGDGFILSPFNIAENLPIPYFTGEETLVFECRCIKKYFIVFFILIQMVKVSVFKVRLLSKNFIQKTEFLTLSYLEVHTGLGRTDLLINVDNQEFVIEAKVFSNIAQFKKGKKQLAWYAHNLNLTTAIYLIFVESEVKNPHVKEAFYGTIYRCNNINYQSLILKTNKNAPILANERIL
jgi:hypothetical protein